MPSTTAPWGAPTNLGPTVNSPCVESDPDLSADGLSLFFPGGNWSWAVNRPGGYGQADIWVTTRANLDDPWRTPVNLGPIVDSSFHDIGPCISADGLALLFHSDRPGEIGGLDLYITRRTTMGQPWVEPVNLGPIVNSSGNDGQPYISPDGATLLFYSARPGGFGGRDLWQAPIIPVVDFNGDGTVDLKDLVILIEHWGSDESFVDVAPLPFGDGVVDVADLEVLMTQWGQQVQNPVPAAQ